MDRVLTYCTNADNRNCPPVPTSLMYGCNTVCTCTTTPYGSAAYYNNQVMTNYISYRGGGVTCCDGLCFNCVCVNTNFACSYVLAQILGQWPNGTALSTASAPDWLANCVGLGGIQCLVGRCWGCDDRGVDRVYRAFYCVSDTHPAVKVELTWTFVSNDYGCCNGSGSTACACYGFKRQMVTTYCSTTGCWYDSNDYVVRTCCYLVYPGNCSFTCSIFNTGSTNIFIHPFNPRHSAYACNCNNYGFGSGGLGIIRFAVYRHCDGRNVSSAASRNCLACYTCPVLKFYPFTQTGCQVIGGLSLDYATCCCGYYYYGGCCGKLLGGSCCFISQTTPTIDMDLAGTYYKPTGGWAIPMSSWRYVCDSSGYCCYRNFSYNANYCVQSTLRNAPVSDFELSACKGAVICQLWRAASGTTSWQAAAYMGNNICYGACMQLFMPRIICIDTWTIDPSICECTTTIRARSSCNYILNGLCSHCGPYLTNCNTTVCLYKNGSCCGAITSCCRYELAMGQCKQRTASMCGSSALPVTDQNGCYILGVDSTIKSVTYTGSATCCKPLLWKRSLQFCAGNTAFWWPSYYCV